MADYRIEVSATAEKQLRNLAQQDRLKVIDTIQQLAANPRPRGSRKLRGYRGVYRVRQGVFRIIYSIERNRLLIIILKLGHRRDVYR